MRVIRPSVLAAILIFASMTANAELIRIDATNDGTIGTNGQFSGFSIIFDDANGDGLLQLGEIVSFSGVDELIGALMRSYTEILGTPDIAGISTQSGFTGGFQGLFWWFNGGPDGWFAQRWTYTRSAVTAVSEPGTLALLGLGLAAMGFGRRRRQTV